MNDAVFEKTMGNVMLVTNDKRQHYLVSKPNDKTTKWFSGKLSASEMAYTKVAMNKTVYLGFSIVDLSKIEI